MHSNLIEAQCKEDKEKKVSASNDLSDASNFNFGNFFIFEIC
jgi:hypothetical protein